MYSSFTVVLLCVAISANFATGTASVETSCSVGALQVLGSTHLSILNNTCFLFVTMAIDKVVFETAQQKCAVFGGTLAMPKTKEINDFLLQEMKSATAFAFEPMWIGMNDKTVEGEWVWDDGTDVKPWNNTNPFNGGWFGTGEDCMALNPTDGQWHDYRCSLQGLLPLGFINSKLPYICQKPVGDGQGDNDDARGQGSDGADGGMKAVVPNNDYAGGCPPFDCPYLDCGDKDFKFDNGCLLCECVG